MDKVDGNEICAGPRRVSDRASEPYYKKAKYGLHLGNVVTYGQTNNHIIMLFNALDTAMNSNNLTVVVVSGWAERMLNKFFPDEQSWNALTYHLPIMKWNSNIWLDPVLFSSRIILERDHPGLVEKNDWRVTQSRRVRMMHYLFSSMQGESCHFLYQLKGYLLGKYATDKYMAVHVRNMEGDCKRFNKWNAEQCEMEPTFIKSVLEQTGLYGKLPIVILSDMQDQEKLKRIQSELEKVVVPQWDMGADPGVVSDITAGGMSEVFVGNQGSSMSRNIGVLREAFGKNVTSSYVFIQKQTDGSWKSLVPHHTYSWAATEI